MIVWTDRFSKCLNARLVRKFYLYTITAPYDSWKFENSTEIRLTTTVNVFDIRFELRDWRAVKWYHKNDLFNTCSACKLQSTKVS